MIILLLLASIGGDPKHREGAASIHQKSLVPSPQARHNSRQKVVVDLMMDTLLLRLLFSVYGIIEVFSSHLERGT